MATSRLKQHLTALLFALAMGLMLALMVPQVDASSFIPLPDNSNLDVPAPEGETAIQQLEDVLGPLGRIIRIVVGAVAVVFIVISGVSMVVGGENEENVKTQRKSIMYGIIGLIMISIAGPIAEVFDYRGGNFLANPDSFIERANLFGDTTRLIVTFLKYLLGSLASLYFIRAGAVMVTSGHSEEDITREKKNIALAAAGLFMVIMSDLVVKQILFDAEYNDSTSETVVQINQNDFITQMVGITNLVVTFVGPIMMLGIVIGGVLYVTAGGDEERTGLAKKIIMNSIIGIIIIYGAFALVSTIIAGSF